MTKIALTKNAFKVYPTNGKPAKWELDLNQFITDNTGSGFATQTLTDQVIITAGATVDGSLTFTPTADSSVILGNSNGIATDGTTDVVRSYVNVTYEGISIGVYDADSETISSYIGINSEGDGNINVVSSYNDINIDAPAGDVIIGNMDANGDNTVRAYIDVRSGSVLFGVYDGSGLDAYVEVTSLGQIDLGAGLDQYINVQSPIKLGSTDNTGMLAITPEDGMILYNSEIGKFVGYENGVWVAFDTTAL